MRKLKLEYGSRLLLFLFPLLLGSTALEAEEMMCSNDQFIRIFNGKDSTFQQFVDNSQLFEERWDTLPQPFFWRKVMSLEADWTVVNRAATREIYVLLCTDEWDGLSDNERSDYRDSLREYYCLPADERIFATTGKRHYYKHDAVMPAISRGTEIFCGQGVDPWYAQAILLIESPGAMNRSPKGALGSFQLMRSVAVRFGLKVSRYRDERKDFDKSAVAASKLISTICIPQTKSMLDKRDICYEEDDIWFRLLVLHVYHAGAGNVAGVMNKIQPTEGNMGLITTIWKTEHGRFRNASQNYSQVALASLLALEEKVYAQCSLLLPEDLPFLGLKMF